MAVRVIGLKELIGALDGMVEVIEDEKLVPEMLVHNMESFAHRRTGYLASTIYHKSNVAGASAPYAGYEADRGGSHDYAQRAIDAFNAGAYLDKIVRPF